MARFPVHPQLASRVSSIELVGDATTTYRVLPTTAVVLGLQIEGHLEAAECPLAPVGVTGLQTGPRHFTGFGPSRSILVRFTPQGASCLGVEARELSDRSTSLADILGSARVAELRERVLEAGDDDARHHAVEAFLLGLPLVEDRLAAAATRMLADARVRVAEVAASLGLSERQLERRMLARVGRAPREYASLVRFERATVMIRSGLPLGEAAFRAGFTDQPHMNRAFRQFAGFAPGRLRERDDAA